jgi:hypothetical protein
MTRFQHREKASLDSRRRGWSSTLEKPRIEALGFINLIGLPIKVRAALTGKSK